MEEEQGQHNAYLLHSTSTLWKIPSPHDTTASDTAADAAEQAAPPPGLNLGTYNIWDGRGFSLPQATRAIQIGNYDLMLPKIQKKAYFHNLLGYEVANSQAEGTTAGGAQRILGLVVRGRQEGWSV